MSTEETPSQRMQREARAFEQGRRDAHDLRMMQEAGMIPKPRPGETIEWKPNNSTYLVTYDDDGNMIRLQKEE